MIYKTRIAMFVKKPPRTFWVALVSFLVPFVYLNLVNNEIAIFDSEYYLALSDEFLENGSFSLLNYPKTGRGLVFPLLLFAFRIFISPFSSSPHIAWRLMISVMISLLSIVFPYFFQGMKRKNMGLLHYVAPVILVLFFWYGLINYILSDFVAIFFLIVGIAALMYALSDPKANIFKIGLLSIVSGILLYAAYNTRTIYLWSLVFFIPAILIFNTLKKKISLKVCFICAICLLAGIMILGSLQGYSNYFRHGGYSIGVNATFTGKELFVFQLESGLKLSQYETYLIFEGDHLMAGAGLHFDDPVGVKLYDGGSFLSFVFQYPFETIGIYVRHFINMLNPVWGGGAYITNLSALKLHRSVINYTMIFIGVKSLVINCRGKSLKEIYASIEPSINTIIAVCAIMMACIAITPGAVESRFYVPMYLLLYGYLAYCLNYQVLWREIKTKPFVNVVCYLAIFIVLCSFWASTYALSDSPVPLSVF